MRNILLGIVFLAIALNAKYVDISDIQKNKKIIQMAVYKKVATLKQNMSKYKLDKNYDLYIHKINNYTVYAVNIKVKKIPKAIKRGYRDAFFISKRGFIKDNKKIVKIIKKKKQFIQKRKKKLVKKQSKKTLVKKNIPIQVVYKDNKKDKAKIYELERKYLSLRQQKDAKITQLVNKNKQLLSMLKQNEKQPNIKTTSINSNLFQKVSVLYETYDIDRIDSNSLNHPQSSSSVGLGYKIGFNKAKYRYYANLKATSGLQALGSYDKFYIYNKYKFTYGASLGYGMYEIGSTSFYVDGLLYGVQAEYIINKQYEIGFQLLKSNMKGTKNGVSYAIDNINYLYLDYKF